jgi:type VI protein secretion system component Hcp
VSAKASPAVTLAAPVVSSQTPAVSEMTVGTGSDAITFPVLSASLGVTQTAGTDPPHVLLVQKRVDKASVALLKLCTTGKLIDSATVQFRGSKGENSGTYTLTRVVISTDRTGASGGSRPVPIEELGFSFGALKAARPGG